jgi:hypothetical protein
MCGWLQPNFSDTRKERKVNVDNVWITDKIKKQIEALILEAILAVLDKLTEQVVTIRDNERKPVRAVADKF